MWAKTKTSSITKNASHGFTIVELLIVIVVIAILAAITVVAFNGVQQRAHNNTTISSVAAYARAVQSYATINNTYPIATNYPCLGPSGTKCANTTGLTAACYGAGAASYTASFDSMIKTVATSLPAPSAQGVSCGGELYAGAFYYSNSSGTTAAMTYYINGSDSCTPPGGLVLASTIAGGSGKQCNISFPNL